MKQKDMNKYNKYPMVVNSNLINFFKEKNKKEEFTILEVGCNVGHNLKALYKIYPKAKYYGIDILSEATEQARNDFPEGNFFTFNIEEPPLYFDKYKYDYILCPDVLEHLTNPKETVKYLRTILKPDGYIFANIPNLMHWTVMANLLIYGNFTYTNIGLLDYDHKHLFTYNEIIKLFEENKFSIDKITNIKLGKIPEDYKQFFESLANVSNGNVNIDQYETFTYMLIAHKNE